jgi:hypothetical protein
MIRRMPRITREVRPCHVGLQAVLLVVLLLAAAAPGRGETLAELLAGVAANARFASAARADVRVECAEGCPAAGGQAIFLGRGDALYVEGTDILLEDLVTFASASLRMPQISDDGPGGVVVTAAPAGTSPYSLLVHTIDRDRHAIVRTLYYRDVVNNLTKTRTDAALVQVAGGWRPGEVVVETLRQATRTRLRLSWRDAADAPDVLFEPAGLEGPSGLAWP